MGMSQLSVDRARPILRRVTPARRLLAYTVRYRRLFLVGFVCVLVNTSLQLAAPWILKLAIDDLTVALTMAKVRGYAASLLALSAIGFAAAMVLAPPLNVEHVAETAPR